MPAREKREVVKARFRKRAAKAASVVPPPPDQASVVATDMLTSPKGRRYTILVTTQTDPYDDPKDKPRKPKSK
jgi:hypothetical protein